MKPLVSILIPVYNVANFIERCAISIFEQTFESIEYIFVDDASPDNSVIRILKILERYPHRKTMVRILSHSTNQGLAQARATALEAANGEYLWFVDSDDYVEHMAVEQLYRRATETGADVVICEYFRVYSKNMRRKITIRPCDKKQYLRDILEYRQMPSICNKFFSSKLFRLHSVSFISRINYGEDYAIVPRLIFHAQKIAFLNTSLYNYVLFNDFSYTRKFRENSIHEMAKATQIIFDFLQTMAPEDNYSTIIQNARIHIKLNLLRLYGCSAFPEQSTLVQLNKLFPEIPQRELFKKAPLPYWPVILFAGLRLKKTFMIYCRLCSCLNQWRLRLPQKRETT